MASDTTGGTAQRSSSADTQLLEVRDLRTTFAVPAGTVTAVDGVSLDLAVGETLGIVGESGSGKTVLSRSIMGINHGDNVTTTGSVKFKGQELLGMSDKKMANLWGPEMAMIFQDPMTSLNPVVPVGRQLTEHMRSHLKLSRSEANERAIELLRQVRIPEPESRIDNYPHEMSGGMRQRVCIAIALACDPELLFADEPTTALDVTVQHQILNLLADTQERRHMAMVMVTHDLGVVAGHSDQIVVMYAGNVVEKAPTKSLFTDVHHPYTEALLRSIPRIEDPAHTRLSVITGRPPDLLNPPAGCPFSPRCPYVQPECLTDKPTLTAVDGEQQHTFACHLPIGSDESNAAFEANLEAEVPQTMAFAGRIQATDDEVDMAATVAALESEGAH